MFKNLKIFQGTVSNASMIIAVALAFIRDKGRIVSDKASVRENEQLSCQNDRRSGTTQKMSLQNGQTIGTNKRVFGTGEQISGTGEQIIGTSNTSSAKSKSSSAASNTSSIKSKSSSAASNSSSFTSKASSAKGKTSSTTSNVSSVKRKTSSAASKPSSLKSKTSSIKSNRSSVKDKSSVKVKVLSPELKEFIANADEYLHYANGLMFYINVFGPAVSFILLRFNSDGLITGFIIVIISKAKQTVYFVSRVENTKIFDGVIELYCGVPP